MAPGGVRRVYPSNPNAFDTTGSSSNVNKKRRGPTKGKGLQKIIDVVGKMPIEVSNVAKRPLNPQQSAKLTSELGVVARTMMKVPTKWRKLDESDKQAGMESIKGKFDINIDDSIVREHCEDRMKSCSRNQRYRLKKLFKTFRTLEEALQNCPENMDPSDWKELCVMWSDPKHQDQCAKNSANRAKVKVHHTTGSRPYIIVHHEMRAKETIQEDEGLGVEDDNVDNENTNLDAIELFKHIHYKAIKGWFGEEAQSAYEKMLEMKYNHMLEGETQIDFQNIVVEVLGVDSSYVQRMGYASKPSKPGSSRRKIMELEKALEISNEERNKLKESQIADKEVIQSQNEKIESQGQMIESQSEKLQSQGDMIESIKAEQVLLIKALAAKGIVL